MFTARYGIYLCIIQVNMNLYGRAMTQAVSRRPHNAETRCRSQASNCDVYSRQSGTETCFSVSHSDFPCQCRSTIALHLPTSTRCSYQKDKRAKPPNFPKSKNLWKFLVALDRKLLSSCFSLWGLMVP